MKLQTQPVHWHLKKARRGRPMRTALAGLPTARSTVACGPGGRHRVLRLVWSPWLTQSPPIHTLRPADVRLHVPTAAHPGGGGRDRVPIPAGDGRGEVSDLNLEVGFHLLTSGS